MENNDFNTIEKDEAQERDDRFDYGFGDAPEEPQVTPVTDVKVSVPELTDEELINESKIRYYRRQLVFALLGIFLSFMFGIGIVFSFVSLISSSKLRSGTNSTIIKWAFYLSIVGLILNAFVIVAFSAFSVLGPAAPPEPVPEAFFGR